MTVNDMLGAGIEFQGDKVILIAWSSAKDNHTLNDLLENVDPEHPARDVWDVTYIYPGSGDRQFIEVKDPRE